MRRVNIHEARTHLPRLVEGAARGEPFVIVRAGKPTLTVSPLGPAEVDTRRRFNSLKGEITAPDGFYTFMQDEIIVMFEGED